MTKGATNYAQCNINGLSCVRESYPTKGMSKESILVLLQSWRIGTQKGYETYINRLVQFCFKWKTGPMEPSVSQILEFLQKLKNSNVGYSGLNFAHLSLSSFLTIERYEARKHPLVCKYMKDVFNINPSLPNYTFTWDVGKVINYLGNKWTDKLKNLSEKTVTLLSILCATNKRYHDWDGH